MLVLVLVLVLLVLLLHYYIITIIIIIMVAIFNIVNTNGICILVPLTWACATWRTIAPTRRMGAMDRTR